MQRECVLVRLEGIAAKASRGEDHGPPFRGQDQSSAEQAIAYYREPNCLRILNLLWHDALCFLLPLRCCDCNTAVSDLLLRVCFPRQARPLRMMRRRTGPCCAVKRFEFERRRDVRGDLPGRIPPVQKGDVAPT